jgi:hypothetical protein
VITDGGTPDTSPTSSATLSHSEETSSPAGSKSTLDHEKRKYLRSEQPARKAATGVDEKDALEEETMQEQEEREGEAENSVHDESSVESEEEKEEEGEEHIDEPPYDDYAEFLAVRACLNVCR